METQEWQAAVCGSISAYTALRGAIDDPQRLAAYLVLSSKALVRNGAGQSELMKATIESPRWDEHERLQELLSQQRARREQSITGNGHGYAMSAASAGMSPVARLNHELSGLAALQKIKQLDDQLGDAAELARYAERLAALHAQITAGARQLLVVADDEDLPALREQTASIWSSTSLPSGGSSLAAEPVSFRVRQIWQANTQVNFCAKAYPTVPVDHPDAAALSVLAGFLRNGFLHRAIREQGGAYGGGASQDSNIAAFRFYSYRDPRLAETLADFDAALDWLRKEKHDPEQLEQAILGVIGSLDKPGSPAGEAKQQFQNELFGRTPEQRRRFRQRILAVTLDDLIRVADIYLRAERASVAVVTNEAGRRQAEAIADLGPWQALTV
jgi:Zn-dependent M16 (insulinase) family peptidase